MISSKGLDLARNISVETTLNGFNRTRKRMLKTHALNDYDMPDFYCTTKRRVPIEAGTMGISNECILLKEEHNNNEFKKETGHTKC